MNHILKLLNDNKELIEEARLAFRLDPRYATDVALRAQKIISRKQARSKKT